MQYLDKLGPFYFGSGGIGDALLLLSSFCTLPPTEPKPSIVFWANNAEVTKDVFRAFEDYIEKAVVFQGWQPREQFKIMVNHPHFLGKAHIPDRLDYVKEWSQNPKKYLDTIKKDQFRNVLLHSFGNGNGKSGILGLGLWGSNQDPWKKRHLTQEEFEAELCTIQETGREEVWVFGSRQDKEKYVIPELANMEVADMRGLPTMEATFEAMNFCSSFCGTDTWFKTYAGFLDIHTTVIKSVYSVPPERVFGLDYDPSDKIFLDKEFWGFDFVSRMKVS